MKSNKPYLIRAFYDWIVDNDCTPFVIINADHSEAKIPTEFIEDGQITLNIAPLAIRDLVIGNEFLEFRASFSGVVRLISAPIQSILAIYADENGQGMFFDFEEEGEIEWGDDESSSRGGSSQTNKNNNKKEKNKRPSHLTLVE